MVSKNSQRILPQPTSHLPIPSNNTFLFSAIERVTQGKYLRTVYSYNTIKHLQRFVVIQSDDVLYHSRIPVIDLYEIPPLGEMINDQTWSAMENNIVTCYRSCPPLASEQTTLAEMAEVRPADNLSPTSSQGSDATLRSVSWKTPLVPIDDNNPSATLDALLDQEAMLLAGNLRPLGTLETSWTMRTASTPPPYVSMDKRRRENQVAHIDYDTVYNLTGITPIETMRSRVPDQPRQESSNWPVSSGRDHRRREESPAASFKQEPVTPSRGAAVQRDYPATPHVVRAGALHNGEGLLPDLLPAESPLGSQSEQSGLLPHVPQPDQDQARVLQRRLAEIRLQRALEYADSTNGYPDATDSSTNGLSRASTVSLAPREPRSPVLATPRSPILAGSEQLGIVISDDSDIERNTSEDVTMRAEQSQGALRRPAESRPTASREPVTSYLFPQIPGAPVDLPSLPPVLPAILPLTSTRAWRPQSPRLVMDEAGYMVLAASDQVRPPSTPPTRGPASTPQPTPPTPHPAFPWHHPVGRPRCPMARNPARRIGEPRKPKNERRK